jgi:hypothetical protein
MIENKETTTDTQGHGVASASLPLRLCGEIISDKELGL